MNGKITLGILALVCLPTLGAEDLVGSVGRPWLDPAIQNLFASNFVQHCATTIIQEPQRNIILTNRLYIVAHLSQTNDLCWDHVERWPNRAYIPYIEVWTTAQSNSNLPETISSIKVFHSRFGDVALTGFTKALKIPEQLMDCKQLNQSFCNSNLVLWTWDKPIIYEDLLADVGNHPENGKVQYNIASNQTVIINFDDNRLESVCLATGVQSRQKPAPTRATLATDLSFIKIGALRILGVETNSVPHNAEQAKRSREALEHKQDLGRPCYQRMCELGYMFEQERTHIGPIPTYSTRLYISPNRNVMIETYLNESYATHYEVIGCVYINVKASGGLAHIRMPDGQILPTTPEECRTRFKCRYSQSSSDNTRIFLNCEGGTFLFVDNKLDQLNYSGITKSAGGIYDLKFKD